jgi:hypothetical protein
MPAFRLAQVLRCDHDNRLAGRTQSARRSLNIKATDDRLLQRERSLCVETEDDEMTNLRSFLYGIMAGILMLAGSVVFVSVVAGVKWEPVRVSGDHQ